MIMKQSGRIAYWFAELGAIRTFQESLQTDKRQRAEELCMRTVVRCRAQATQLLADCKVDTQQPPIADPACRCCCIVLGYDHTASPEFNSTQTRAFINARILLTVCARGVRSAWCSRPQSVDGTHQYASECSRSHHTSHSTELWRRRPWEQRARDGRRPYVPISACGRGAPACSWDMATLEHWQWPFLA